VSCASGGLPNVIKAFFCPRAVLHAFHTCDGAGVDFSHLLDHNHFSQVRGPDDRGPAVVHSLAAKLRFIRLRAADQPIYPVVSEYDFCVGNGNLLFNPFRFDVRLRIVPAGISGTKSGLHLNPGGIHVAI
jgi:hypothetical protein